MGAEGDALRQKLVSGVGAQALGFLAAPHKGMRLLLLADLAKELCLDDGDDTIDHLIQCPSLRILYARSQMEPS